jgi:hypothetical protein
MLKEWVDKFPFALPLDHKLSVHLDKLKEWTSDKDSSWAQVCTTVQFSDETRRLKRLRHQKFPKWKIQAVCYSSCPLSYITRRIPHTFVIRAV